MKEREGWGMAVPTKCHHNRAVTHQVGRFSPPFGLAPQWFAAWQSGETDLLGERSGMGEGLFDVLEMGAAFALLAANAFFVAAEFALVKVQRVRLEQMLLERRMFAATAVWLADRLEASLSACQLGITIASLALGWIAEPAFESLLEPLLHSLGIESPTILRALGVAIALTVITALHLVLGEQTPKIFAIRRPEPILLVCAVPLKWFLLLTYPLMAMLDLSTRWILRSLGLREGGHHEAHSEEEIRALIRESHLRGHLTRSERHLIESVFEFDDMVCRRVMVPRAEVDVIDLDEPLAETLPMVRRTKHTRYPVCRGSLDEVLGVVHVKDLVGLSLDTSFDFRRVMRPPKKVPENMPISRLLRHFQATHQLMAFVVDEYGTVIGIVTLENVLEQIIGDVADEFDVEQPDFVPDGPERWIVKGSVDVAEVERRLGIEFGDVDVDTFSGVLTDKAGRLPEAGDVIDLGPYEAEILETRDSRATRIRVTLKLDSEGQSSVRTMMDDDDDDR